MAEYNINKIKLPNGDIVKLVDETSGYTKNTGTVTSVGLQNATNGGLSVSGSPVTGSGTISVGHSNILTNAQTTQALYPIAIDKNGHISSYGSAVDPEDIFLFEVTGSSSTPPTYTVTTTPNQLSSAIEAGKVPVIKLSYANRVSETYYHFSEIAPTGDGPVYYYFTNPLDGGVSIIELYTTSTTASSFSDVYVGSALFALADHSHGNINIDGQISSTAVTPGNGDYILISDSSGSNKIERGIAIGTGTTKYLREDGTWQTVSSTDTITSWYGTCSTSAAEKTVTCSGYTLTAGNIIGVLFSSANIFSTPTLNVNSTGAKSIYIGNATPNDTTNVLKWSANTMVYFMYDGTYYRYITSISAADVAPSRGANTWYGTSNTSATTQAKTSTIDNFVLTKGAIISINFSTANTYTSAKLTLNVNGTGVKDIYKNNATTSSTNTLLWDANTTLTFIYDGSHYQLARQRITSDDVTKALGSQAAHKVLISSDTSGTLTYPSFRTLVADDLPSITTSKISDFPSSIVTDVQIGGTSILSSGVANIVTNSTYNSSTNKIATMSDLPSVPSAGTTASAVGTTSSGGSATTWSKSDHVHSISSSTITSALGYTPASGDTKVKLTSVTSSSEFPLVLGPSSISSGTAYEGNYVSSITVNASSRQLTLQAIKLDYDSNCYATININGYGGTTTNNTPNVTFYSLKGNYGDTSNHNVYLKGIATPSSDYDAANKKYVDDAVGAISDTKVTNTLATTTKYYVTGTTSASTNTGTQYFDTGIYATTTAGQLQATSYKVTANATIQYNSTDSSIDFTFI